MSSNVSSGGDSGESFGATALSGAVPPRNVLRHGLYTFLIDKGETISLGIGITLCQLTWLVLEASGQVPSFVGYLLTVLLWVIGLGISFPAAMMQDGFGSKQIVRGVETLVYGFMLALTAWFTVANLSDVTSRASNSARTLLCNEH